MLSSEDPLCHCLGSINLRRPPIWDVKYAKAKNRIWKETTSVTPHSRSDPTPLYGFKRSTNSETRQNRNSSLTASNSDRPSATIVRDRGVDAAPPLSTLPASDPPDRSRIRRTESPSPSSFGPPCLSPTSLTDSVVFPFLSSASFPCTATATRSSPYSAASLSLPSTAFPYTATPVTATSLPYSATPLSSQFTYARYSCLGEMNLRRPSTWDMKHVPIVRHYSTMETSTTSFSPTISSNSIAPSISSASLSKTPTNRISPRPSSASLTTRGLKEFTWSILDEAWAWTDVARDWLFPPSRGEVAKEMEEGRGVGDEENEEDDEGIVDDGNFTLDLSPWKETPIFTSTRCKRKFRSTDAGDRLVGDRVGGRPNFSNSDKDSDSSSDSEISVADSGVFSSSSSSSCSFSSSCCSSSFTNPSSPAWGEPKTKKKKYGS